MNENYKNAIKALKTVLDPDIKKDLITLNMIKELKVDDESCSFKVELTTPACPLKEKIRKDCEKAIIEHLGENIEINITMDSSVQASRPLNKDEILPNVKNIIAIASGKGGVGKSTVACNLAVTLVQSGAKVGLLDADIFGPSQPTLFGVSHEKPKFIKKGEKSMLVPIENYDVKMMSIGFMAPENAAIVWRGPMASQALKQFITEVEWGELDYLIVDLPPGTSDIHLTITQTLPLVGVIIVTTPQKVALTDVKKGISMFRQKEINVPIIGVVQNMSYFTPKELPENKYYIFGKDGGKKVADEYDVPFLGEIPLNEVVRERGDTGNPISENESDMNEFQPLVDNIVRNIAKINNNIVLDSKN